MYLQELSPLSLLETNFGFVELTFNEQIDFAIWVLIESGTLVSPFDLHSIKTSHQRFIINPEQWYEWLTTLIAVFDPRWLCQVKNLSSEIESELAQYQSLVKNYSWDNTYIPSFDWVTIRENIEQRLAWKQLQYAQAIQEYGQRLAESLSPVTYWKYHNETRIWLVQMWNLYQNTPSINSNINQLMQLSENLAYSKQDTIKKIYLVNYPSVIQCQVSSTTTIIGIPQSQEIDIQSLLHHLNHYFIQK
ncbi:hypothetical protein [Nostoc sp. UHCC 0870]|uniref:hypothetical protein n=1 Tax=Nostoc sp. UHCC 0870 TaxID=2914041 RepID=UPI001EE021F7|nr:hypothetical protein [Nostoc sp. UHCC 0870]UKP01026.1 hypothetical protein L6494_28165 [Nostoc sp. UHCC 0870]